MCVGGSMNGGAIPRWVPPPAAWWTRQSQRQEYAGQGKDDDDVLDKQSLPMTGFQARDPTRNQDGS